MLYCPSSVIYLFIYLYLIDMFYDSMRMTKNMQVLLNHKKEIIKKKSLNQILEKNLLLFIISMYNLLFINALAHINLQYE